MFVNIFNFLIVIKLLLLLFNAVPLLFGNFYVLVLVSAKVTSIMANDYWRRFNLFEQLVTPVSTYLRIGRQIHIYLYMYVHLY